MAVGDITYDANNPRLVGVEWEISGTVVADSTARTFALCNTSCRIMALRLTPKDDSLAAQVQINANAAGTGTNGTVTVRTNLATANTIYYTLRYV